VKRTFPHLHFFRGETERHPEALREILFIWAKLNPGVRYVQGMNEILGPIYYLFATDPDESYREHCEADAFFCFTNVMSEIMNNFIKTLDKSDLGIVGKMRDMTTILMQKDPQLARNLEDKNLNPQFYSFRWITLMLSQEFELPDVLRLWDTLFSDAKRFQFLLFFCCAMLVAVRERLLSTDFAENLKLLQQYPPGDIEDTIALATRLRDDELWECPFWEPAPPAPEPVDQPVPRGESASDTLTAMAKALADNVVGQ
jgi:TBC1 domain family member 13